MTIEAQDNQEFKDKEITFYDKLHKNLPLFLQILMAEGHLTPEDIKSFARSSRISHIDLEPMLIPVVGKKCLLDALSREFQTPMLELDQVDISPRVGLVIPQEVGRSHQIACVGLDDEGIQLAMVNPIDENAVNHVETITDFRVTQRFVVLPSDLSNFQDLLYGSSRALPLSPRDMVDDIIRKAIEQDASDIHIEPFEDNMKIRFRKDGVLTESYSINETMLKERSHKKFLIQHLKRALPVVVKNKSGASGRTMDNAETQKCQDGRIYLPMKHIEMRVSVLPSVHGESVAIRILNPEREQKSFLNLGFSESEEHRFSNVIKSPYGIVLVSGPTGSGKTTTLYTVLKQLNSPSKKILTVEDPVEYTICGIVQIQTNAAKEVTFASALRSFLRHDPDIIMVGEIRDRETAQMAIEASLTGHLVLSTIHANDAVRTITRIKDLGVNPLLITSTCLATMAQRLLRLNCPNCAEPAEFSPRLFRLMDYFNVEFEKEKLKKSKGCKSCNDTGYKGRTGIYELLLITPEVQEAILKSIPDLELEHLARKQGMRLLIEDALSKAAQGLTTEEEVFRVTLSDYLADRKEQQILEDIKEGAETEPTFVMERR